MGKNVFISYDVIDMMICCVAGCDQKHVCLKLRRGDPLLKSPLKINGMKFYYTVITFPFTVLGLANWIAMFVGDTLT